LLEIQRRSRAVDELLIHLVHRRAAPEQQVATPRGQDQPVDKSRAQQTSVGEECPGEKANCDAPAPPWDPAVDDKSAGSIPIDHLNASNDD
jgi:hypothetical protein